MKSKLPGNRSVRCALAICALTAACLCSTPAFAQVCTQSISPCTVPGSVSSYTGGPGTASYTYGTITNTGSIQITAGLVGSPPSSANASLNVEAGVSNGTTTLTGGGTLTLSTSGGTGVAFITDGTFSGGNSLINLNNTIQGYGQIGNGSDLKLSNSGTVNANVSGLGLILNNGGVTNTGLLEATNGGSLNISSVVNNSGGNITTTGTATVSVNSTIQGGTLNGAGLLTGPGNATLDGASQGTLTLSTGSTYTGANGTTTFVLGTIVNNGNIQLNGGATGNTKLFLTGNTALQGGGTLTLNNGANAALITETFASPFTLTNGMATSASTIQGSGQIGNGSALTLVNNALGIVNANVSGGSLILNGNPGTNTGLLEATNGGNLNISNVVNNSGGNITTTDTATASVNSTIQGGTLNGAGLQTGASGATLDGSTQGALTLSTGSTYTGANGTLTQVLGTIVNHGNIQINGGASSDTRLFLTGNTTLQGGGAVTLNNGANGAYITDTFDGGFTLTNGTATSASTIRGSGQIGNGGDLQLANNALSTVNANVSGATLYLNGGTVTNTGLLEATNGGNLQISTTVNNLNGTISTDSGLGSAVSVSSTIQGGTLGGTLQTNGSATLDGSTRGSLTLSTGATYTGGAGTTTNVLGTIVNNGNIQLNAGASTSAVLFLTGNMTLQGGGTLTLNSGSGTGLAYITNTFDSGFTLTNSGDTIQGYGQVGNGGSLNVINGAGGKLLANVAGQTLTVNGTGGLTNNGTMQANAGSTLLVTQGFTNFSAGTLTGGTYNVYGTGSSAGTIQIDALGTAGGEIVTNNATIVLNGPNSDFVDDDGHNALSALAGNEGTLDILGGRNFSTPGSLDNSGTLDIGATDIFTVNGAYSDPPSADLIFNIDGLTNGNGFLGVTGSANFAGTQLNLDAINSFDIVSGDVFVLADYGTLSSDFSSVDTAGLNLAAGLTAAINYDYHNDNEIALVIGGNTSATPEPSTWILFAAGLSALAAFRMARRRRIVAEGAAKDSCA